MEVVKRIYSLRWCEIHELTMKYEPMRALKFTNIVKNHECKKYAMATGNMTSTTQTTFTQSECRFYADNDHYSRLRPLRASYF